GVNRLISASESGPGTAWSQTYGYDRFGNRYVPATSGLTYGDNREVTTPDAFSPQTNKLVGPSYDAAGNQTSYLPYTMNYDAENRQVNVTSPNYNENGAGSFSYD